MQRIGALKGKLKASLLHAIASLSGMDGIEIATALAKADPDDSVKSAVLEALLFRRAERQAVEILEGTTDEVWRKLASKWDYDEFASPALVDRLKAETEKQWATETEPARLISTLLHARRKNSETGAKIRDLLVGIDFSKPKEPDGSFFHLAYERYPTETIQGLLGNLERGGELPFRSEEMLRASGIILDDGPIMERLSQSRGKDKTNLPAVSIAGPNTVGALIDKLKPLQDALRNPDGSHNKEANDEYHRILGLVSSSPISSFTTALLKRAPTDDVGLIALYADLVSRHGRDLDRKQFLLDGDVRNDLSDAVVTWTDKLLASPVATRAQIAEIPQAAERVRSPRLLEVVDRCLREDLKRRKQSRLALAEARAQGKRIDSDSHMSWSLQYRRALAAIGDDAVALLVSYLPDLEFGVDAAYALSAIWSGAERDDRIVFRADFSDVRKNRGDRTAGKITTTHPFADALLAVVVDFIKPDAGEEQLRHAFALATVAFTLPYSNHEGLIDTLLSLSRPIAEKQNLLTSLAISGAIIPAVLVLEGVNDLIERSKTQRWLIDDQEGWRLNSWLQLFPFSDAPTVALDVIRGLPENNRGPWNLGTFLSSLGYSPSVKADNVLAGLVAIDPKIFDDYEWMAALRRRESVSAAKILLDHISALSPEAGLAVHHRHDIERDLSYFVAKHTEIRRELYNRFAEAAPGPLKAIYERTMFEVPDVEGIILLVKSHATQNTALRHRPIYTALRNILIGQRDSAHGRFQELYPLPSTDIRKALFDMVLHGFPAAAKIAAECLVDIDEIHDDYGYLESEPRHPDIDSGKPWPEMSFELK